MWVSVQQQTKWNNFEKRRQELDLKNTSFSCRTKKREKYAAARVRESLDTQTIWGQRFRRVEARCLPPCGCAPSRRNATTERAKKKYHINQKGFRTWISSGVRRNYRHGRLLERRGKNWLLVSTGEMPPKLVSWIKNLLWPNLKWTKKRYIVWLEVSLEPERVFAGGSVSCQIFVLNFSNHEIFYSAGNAVVLIGFEFSMVHVWWQMTWMFQRIVEARDKQTNRVLGTVQLLYNLYNNL